MSDPQSFWNEFAAENEMRWAEALSRLLQFETVSGASDPDAEAAWRGRIGEAMDFLADLARGLGFETRRHENRVLVVEAPGPDGAPALGLPIHLDVVPAGEGWTREPFGGEIADGAVWGRGAQDDKGPIVEALFALHGARRLIERAGRSWSKTVRLIVVSEEEIGVWDDIPYYFEREAPPDFCIVPDAAFPITVGEKGFVNLEVEIAWTPKLGGALEIAAGERPNVVPARATLRAGAALLEGLADPSGLGEELLEAPRPPRIAVEDGVLRGEFYGVGAHGSLPHKGHNAAGDALALAASLPGLRAHPAGRAAAWLARAAADTAGGALGIDHRDPRVGATTVSLGVLRVDGASARAVLNIRNPIGLPCREVENRVRAAAERFAETTDGIVRARARATSDYREPIYVDPDRFREWIEPMQAAYTAVTGRPAGLETIGGTTFAKAFPNAVCFGPVDQNEEEELAHQADEHVTLAAMRRNVEIYGRAIAGIVG